MNPAATRSRTPEPPYCWQSKEALRQIERTYDSESRTRLACSAYLALTRIASDRRAESFECSIKEIARCMHYNYEEALEGVKLAEAARVVRVERRKVTGTKENAPSIYSLLRLSEIPIRLSGPPSSEIPIVYEVIEKEERTHPPTSLDCVEVVCDFSSGGNGMPGMAINPLSGEHNSTSPTTKADQGEEQPARTRRSHVADGRADDGGFEKFWSAYPRRVCRRDAERAWAKLKPPLGKVLAALKAWRNSPAWLQDGGRYIPHPATWLNRGGWEDELPDGRQQPESFI
jgi:hypothetical protein